MTFIWSHFPDSNWGPSHYKCDALASWAKVAYIKLVTRTGIEPMSPPWKGDVLTAWPRGLIYKELNNLFNHLVLLVSYPRLERGTTWLKVKCSTTWANSPYACIAQRLYILHHFLWIVNTFLKFFWNFLNFCWNLLFETPIFIKMEISD